MTIEEEINAMLDAGGPTKAPSTESSATEAPGTEPSATKAPGTEPSATKAPGTEAPGTKAPTTEAPSDGEDEKLKEENERLRQQIEELHKKEPSPTKAPSTEAPVSEVDFIGDEIDPENLVRDKKALNVILNKVYRMGMDAIRRGQEDTLRGIPDIVKTNVATQTSLRKEVESFYSDNKDLQPFKKVVAAVYEELASDNADWTVKKVFEEVGKETRKRLELHKKATTPTTSAPKGPNFPKTKSSRKRPKPKPDKLIAEIDAMNKF